MPRYKIEQLDVNFDYQEKLLKSLEVGIKDTKKKLNDTEIMITLEPNKKDMAEWGRWDKTITEIMSRKPNLTFPNLTQMKKEQEMKRHNEIDPSRRSRLKSRESYSRQAQRVMERQTHNMQKKILEGKCKFGGSVVGEVIGTVEKYRGSSYDEGGKRILRRKDGRNHFTDPADSSVPPWMGPMYYFDSLQDSPAAKDKYPKSDRFYKMPFEALPRGKVRSTAVVDREHTTRRRLELRTAASNSSSPDGAVRERSNSPISTSTWGGLRPRNFEELIARIKDDDVDVDDDHASWDDAKWEKFISSEVPTTAVDDGDDQNDNFSQLSGSQHSRGGSFEAFRSLSPPPQENAIFDQNASQHFRESAMSPAANGDSGPLSPSMKEILKNRRTTDYELGTRHPHVIQQYDQRKIAAGIMATDDVSISTNTVTTISDTSSTKQRASALLAQRQQENFRSRHNVSLDPLVTQHAFELKLLQTDTVVQQLRPLPSHLQQQKKEGSGLYHRNKDYTYKALAGQKPLIMDNFPVENSVENVVKHLQLQQQQPQNGPAAANTQALLLILGASNNATTVASAMTGSVPSSASATAGPHRRGSMGLKYSSDIFKKPTADYRSADVLVTESKVVFNASHLVPDPFASSSVPTGGAVTNSAATAASNGGSGAVPGTASGSMLGSKSASRPGTTAVSAKVGTPGEVVPSTLLTKTIVLPPPRRSMRPYGHLAKLALQQSLDKSSVSNQTFSLSRPTTAPAPTDSDVVASPTGKLSPSLSLPAIVSASVPGLSPGLTASAKEIVDGEAPVDQLLDSWCAEHGVYRSHDLNKYSQKRRLRKKLDTNYHNQRKHRQDVDNDTWDTSSQLSLKMQLNGLLLDEDPAETHPDLIAANRDRDIDHIVLR